MNAEATEDLTNDLIEICWPLLDEGVSQSDILDAFENAMSAWTPKPGGAS